MKLLDLVKSIGVLVLLCIQTHFSFAEGSETNFLNEVVGTETNGFKLIISTSTNSFIEGQEIDLIVSQKNISTNSMTVRAANNLMYDMFEVVDPDGHKLRQTEAGKQWSSPETMF